MTRGVVRRLDALDRKLANRGSAGNRSEALKRIQTYRATVEDFRTAIPPLRRGMTEVVLLAGHLSHLEPWRDGDHYRTHVWEMIQIVMTPPDDEPDKDLIERVWQRASASRLRETMNHLPDNQNKYWISIWLTTCFWLSAFREKDGLSLRRELVQRIAGPPPVCPYDDDTPPEWRAQLIPIWRGGPSPT